MHMRKGKKDFAKHSACICVGGIFLCVRCVCAVCVVVFLCALSYGRRFCLRTFIEQQIAFQLLHTI